MLHLPRLHYEWIMFLTFWFGGLWLVYFELVVVSPSYHDSWNSMMKFHTIFATFVALNIYTNMFLMITTDISVKQIDAPTGPPPPGWKFCAKCEINTPPRSHHCKVCQTCILKRDHHCFFAGYCIGHFNHRYFIAMVVYMTIAAVYCNVYNWQYFMEVKGGFVWSTIPGIIAPHFGLMLGYYSIYEFLLTSHTFVGFMLNLMFFALLIAQVMYCFTGQLHYENKKGVDDYRVGLRKTCREVFGTAGLLIFICPLIPTKLPGNGTSFPLREDDSSGRGKLD